MALAFHDELLYFHKSLLCVLRALVNNSIEPFVYILRLLQLRRVNEKFFVMKSFFRGKMVKALKWRKLRNEINVPISSLTCNYCLLYTWVPLYYAAHYISRVPPIKRERGSLEDGILQRIKNSLSSFHLPFILLRSLISYEQYLTNFDLFQRR